MNLDYYRKSPLNHKLPGLIIYIEAIEKGIGANERTRRQTPET